MACEIDIRMSLRIRKDKLDYQSNPTGFTDDLTGTKGPTPGAIAVSTQGTNVDLSQLTTPGWCWLQNLDVDNYVEWGIYDTERDVFFPIGELGPGQTALYKCSRNVLEEYFPATGTGTTAPTNKLRLRADKAACNVRVEVFEA